MYQYKAAKIEVETIELESMLIGAQLICEGLNNAMDWNLEGILNLHKNLSREENAYEFLSEKYTAIQGVFQTVGSILATLNAAIENEDISLEPGNRLQMIPPPHEQGRPSK